MDSLKFLKSKIIPEEKLGNRLHYWQFHNQKIVFTNGCFDILHRGHVEYLAQAADLGDRLIIGLNSDSSVKKLKGKNRPVNTEKDRSFLLAALDFVDAVVIFKEETPFELIRKVQPDVLVKGGDWKVEEIVGSDVVLAKGGEVKSLNFVEGYSTTATIDKMKS